MVKIIWHYGEPPKDMMVRQVYCMAFDQKGRVLLKVDHINGKTYYGMFGGTPESYDKDRLDTLRREYLEEANTTLKDPIYLVGYQEIEGDADRPNYAQLRMVAMVDKIGEKMPDADCGRVFERIFVTPERAIQLLNWGESGEKQVKEAYKIAKEKFNIQTTCQQDEFV